MYADHEIQVNFNRNLELIGLKCGAKEYKLAWHLNRQLSLKLAKTDDLVINFASQPSIIISNFVFTTTHCTFRLLKNESAEEGNPLFLLPEMQHYDFFLMINNESDTFETADCLLLLDKVPLLEAYQIIDIDKLTNHENLIF